MRLTNNKLANEILKVGQREFLEKGYEKASLRVIAASLGVTTGAIYRYYSDKATLFETLVKEPAEQLLNHYRAIQNSFADKPLEDELNELGTFSKNGHDEMFQIIYDNIDAFKLIVCCSVGTAYEHYIDQLVEIEVNASILIMEKMKAQNPSFQPIEESLIHILASAMFSGMFETVCHDMPRQKAKGYIEDLRIFYEAGWNRLLEITK